MCNLININPFILQSLPYINSILNSYTMLKKSNKHAYLSKVHIVFNNTSMFVISEGKPASRDR